MQLSLTFINLLSTDIPIRAVVGRLRFPRIDELEVRIISFISTAGKGQTVVTSRIEKYEWPNRPADLKRTLSLARSLLISLFGK